MREREEEAIGKNRPKRLNSVYWVKENWLKYPIESIKTWIKKWLFYIIEITQKEKNVKTLLNRLAFDELLMKKIFAE